MAVGPQCHQLRYTWILHEDPFQVDGGVAEFQAFADSVVVRPDQADTTVEPSLAGSGGPDRASKANFERAKRCRLQRRWPGMRGVRQAMSDAASEGTRDWASWDELWTGPVTRRGRGQAGLAKKKASSNST